MDEIANHPNLHRQKQKETAVGGRKRFHMNDSTEQYAFGSQGSQQSRI